MRVRFSEQVVSAEMLDFLRRSECDAERRGDYVLEVNPRQEMLPHAARLEVEGLLRVWQKLHPEAAAEADFLGQARR